MDIYDDYDDEHDDEEFGQPLSRAAYKQQETRVAEAYFTEVAMLRAEVKKLRVQVTQMALEISKLLAKHGPEF